ncbi:unnamed protein product [Oikopleura dioica]|uniref:Uncharacterized protein n=1 Tax=Oikopleura dioica TaxID=34765 RepID=E4WWA6_OIKDI|nr:unnamed protein product [Oikopleura dioica]CBY40499.1 unnamed protein product [Oikopleura dioica]
MHAIRDRSDRSVRRASVAPNFNFVVEEGILEDLCEIAGEEAEIGGEIMLGDDKSDLLKRISKNTATKDIFKNQDSYQSFVNNKITGSGSSTLELATTTKESVTSGIASQPSTTICKSSSMDRKKSLAAVPKGKIATQIATQTNITSEEAALEIVEQNAKKEKSLFYKVKKAVLCYKS